MFKSMAYTTKLDVSAMQMYPRNYTERDMRELEEYYRRKNMQLEDELYVARQGMMRPQGMMDPDQQQLKAVRRCQSCNGDEHGGKVDMIGYCENRLKKYYKNLSKLTSSKNKI